ncbi:MAG: ligase-associated DNA damage response endonuclease PdeM [Hyphomicrobiaceae bacterium]
MELKPERLTTEDFAEQEISLCGKSFFAHMSGGLYWPSEKALIVADLHLEKGSSFAARGQMLPPYDTRETLHRLANTIDHCGAETVIALGDSFHDRTAGERMSGEDLETLAIMQDSCEWIWIAGNHDPEIPENVRGYVIPELTASGITFRHEPKVGPVTHEVAGHLHPAAKISLNGFSLRRPCFVGNGVRLIMPAFGAFTGGLNILDDVFSPHLGNEGVNVWMLGQEGLYPVASRLLRED